MGSDWNRTIDPDSKHSIEKVLLHYGAQLQRCNPDRWSSVRCPFHGDGRASAAVHLNSNAFACYACGIKGDTYAIIMQHEGIGFRAALALAEEITGISGETLRPERASGTRIPGRSRSVLRDRPSRRLRGSE